MSHGVIIESEEDKGGHAYGGGVGVTWHPWQVITQTDMKTSAYDPKSFLRKHSLLLQYQIFLMTLGKLCMDSVAPSGLLLCDPGVLRGFHQWWRMIGRCLLFKKVDLVYWIIGSLKKLVSPQLKASKKPVKSMFTVDIKSRTFRTVNYSVGYIAGLGGTATCCSAVEHTSISCWRWMRVVITQHIQRKVVTLFS